jgi:hypothetical protein
MTEPQNPCSPIATPTNTSAGCTFNDVSHPSHYMQAAGVECIDVLEALAASGHDFRILQAMRYLWRYRHKDNPRKDVQKAIEYLQRWLAKGGA